MKTHSPIKRHKAIASFSKDHHFGLLLVWKIRHGLKNAVSAGRIATYVLHVFNEDLDKHFKEEEELLFSRLPEDDRLRKRAESEHLSINKLVAFISADKNNTGLLQQFADELENHIRFEERQLFNHLQTKITDEDLEFISKRMANNGNLIDEKWSDVFWAINQ